MLPIFGPSDPGCNGFILQIVGPSLIVDFKFKFELLELILLSLLSLLKTDVLLLLFSFLLLSTPPEHLNV
tara:strand:+ start:421 stop:630 length:210 start_codon:yes stop_codon:yes gene_type:complete